MGAFDRTIPYQVIADLPFEDYLLLDALSAHGLMLLERSPLHYLHSKTAPRAPTPAQALGTLTHLAILEWDRYEALVRVQPDVNRRTNAGKEAAAEFEAQCQAEGWTVATAEQDQKARRMRESVMAQPFARALLADGMAETSLLFERDGVTCKARPDWLCGSHEAIVDVKTAADASEAGFARASGQWRYHLQAAFYQDAALICGLKPRAFIFLAVEPEEPHAAALYELDDQAIHAGRIRCQRALEVYRECLSSGRWDGYPTPIQTIQMPKWAL